MPTPAIRNLIRDDKVHQIYSTMQTGQEKLGMQTMNQNLATLYQKRLITLETAHERLVAERRARADDQPRRRGRGRGGHAPGGDAAADDGEIESAQGSRLRKDVDDAVEAVPEP